MTGRWPGRLRLRPAAAGHPDADTDRADAADTQAEARTTQQAEPDRADAPPPAAIARKPSGTGPIRRDGWAGVLLVRMASTSWRLLLVAATATLIGYVLTQLWVVVLPVLLAVVLATVLWPPTRWLRQRGLPPAAAALVVLLGALLLLTGLVSALVSIVIARIPELSIQVQGGLIELQRLVAGPPLNLGREQLGQYIQSVLTSLRENTQQIAEVALGSVGVVGSFLITAILAIVIAFFLVKDGPRFLPWIRTVVGSRWAVHVETLGLQTWDTVGGFIRTQALVGLIDAFFISIGLVILGVPLVLPLAVLIFIGAFVPIVGAVVTGALAALVALVTQGVTTALIVVGVVLLVQQLEGNVLQPMLVGRVLSLHPVVVLLAVTAGTSLAGIIGAFLAVPAVAVGSVLLGYASTTLGTPAEDRPGRSAEHPTGDG